MTDATVPDAAVQIVYPELESRRQSEAVVAVLLTAGWLCDPVEVAALRAVAEAAATWRALMPREGVAQWRHLDVALDALTALDAETETETESREA